MTEPVLLRREGAIAFLTLNRPDTRNALSADVVDAIEAACAELNQDMSVGCAVLTGAGPHFSSGGNVKEMYDGSGMFGGSSAAMEHAYRHGIQRIPKALYELEVPIVAAINGAAIGAGLDLSLMCDVRIAAKNAIFAESFVRLGLISGDGGSWFLPRVIGMARASEMTLTGESIGVDRAVEWGLVSRVVELEELLPTATEIAGRIAAHPHRSTRLAKRLLRDSQQLSLAAALDKAAAMQSIVQHTADQREAVAAFIEKRPPNFTGA
jgi:enoyl-CoA hydratase/carnithine racemase